jgi:phage gp36-like protein
MSQYATTTDLAQYALGSVALTGISTNDQDAALQAASDEADGYLKARYAVPVTVYGKDLREHICAMAAYRLLSRKTFGLDGSQTNIRKMYEDAISFFSKISKGLITLSGDAITPAPSYALPRVSTSTPRGW